MSPFAGVSGTPPRPTTRPERGTIGWSRRAPFKESDARAPFLSGLSASARQENTSRETTAYAPTSLKRTRATPRSKDATVDVGGSLDGVAGAEVY